MPTLNYKKLIPSLAIALACLVFLYVALGPFISLHAIKQAIETKDQVTLERYVDFPELQHNIKQRYRKQAAKALGFDNVETGNLLSRFALQISEQFIDLSVESLVNPSGLSLLLSGADLNQLVLDKAAGRPEREEQPGNSIEPEQKNMIARKDLSFFDLLENSRFSYINHQHFIFEFENKKAQDAAMRLVFLRHGLRWKLSNVIFIE